MNARPLLLVIALGLLGTTGCAYLRYKPPLEAQESTAYVNDDLPIPVGFELDKHASWRHERSTYRRFKLVYRAQDYYSAERAAEFIRARYPAAGWETTFVTGVEETHFVFEKGPEECRVDVRQDFGDCFTEFVVTVEPRRTPEGEMVAREQWSELGEAPPAAPDSSK